MPNYEDPRYQDQYSVKRILEDNFMKWSAESPPTVQKLPVEELDTDFKREFPPDVFGREMDDSARVWKVYRAHATSNDDALLDGWNETINILLVFAGLFSAVVTAFLIESYKTLQFDNDAYIVTALHILASNIDGNVRDILPIPPSPSAGPSLEDRWINGLWFMSLFLALAVSLLSILIKQWLREYKARNDASAQSPRHWARRRGFLFKALTSWRVAEFISVLPVLLHIALFLFLIGTVIFLWTLDKAIGISILIAGSALGIFYLISIGIPLWKPECPTSTPVVNLIRLCQASLQIATICTFVRFCELYRKAYSVAEQRTQRGYAWLRSSAFSTFFELLMRRVVAIAGPTQAWLKGPRGVRIVDPETAAASSLPRSRRLHIPMNLRRRCATLLTTVRARLPGLQTLSHQGHLSLAEVLHSQVERLTRTRTDQDMILSHLSSYSDTLDARALMWLITIVSDSDAVAVALQALGAIRPSSRTANLIRSDSAVSMSATADAMFTRSPGERSPVEVARVARTLFFMGRTPAVYPDEWPWLHRLKSTEYPDCDVLATAITAGKNVVWSLERRNCDPRIYIASSTCTQTCMLLLHRYGSTVLGLLRYCALDSSDVDWDVVQKAARVDDEEGHDLIPSNITPVAASAASVCRGLLRRLVGREVDRSEFISTSTTIVTLMRLICRHELDTNSPNAKLGVIDLTDGNPLHAYGSDTTDFYSFFASTGFRRYNPSYEDLNRVLAFLQFRICLAFKRRDFDDARSALTSLQFLLAWAGRHKPNSFPKKCAALMQSFLPLRGDTLGFEEAAERLSLLLLPNPKNPSFPTFWHSISQYTQEHWLLRTFHALIVELYHLKAVQPPGRPDMVDALLAETPYMDFAYDARGPGNRLALFRTFEVYTRLCPERWAEDKRVALASGDESIHAFVWSFENSGDDPLLSSHMTTLPELY